MDHSYQNDSTLQFGACDRCGRRHDSGDADCNPSSIHNGLIGKTIGGKYQIISLVGEGGMSVVYKAKQFPINKIVALKMLLQHLSSDPSSSQRFLQEAKAAGQISHPNIVSVLDYGRDEKNHPYLVMDFLEGESLADVLKARTRLPHDEAVQLFIQICDGLSAAHAHGVIHRDMKPSNIVIQQQANGEKIARIVDFGIAKVVDAETQALTKTGEVFGSPLYMSPEQCEGAVLDHRSDIYSLGVVFYETLSGVRPHVGQSALETMRMHMMQIAESLQKVSDGAHIPLALENIVFKMMEKDREKRYANVAEIKKDLLEVAAGDRKALSGNLQYVGRELSRKSKVLVAASIVLVSITVAGFFSYPYACAAIAKQQYDEGYAQLQNSNFSAAEPLLRTAVDLNQRIGDKQAEGRGLRLLAQVYRNEGKMDLLDAVRSRRQKLIKEQLLQMELSSDSVDALLAAASSGEDSSVARRQLSVVQTAALPELGSGAALTRPAGERKKEVLLASAPPAPHSPVPADKQRQDADGQLAWYAPQLAKDSIHDSIAADSNEESDAGGGFVPPPPPPLGPAGGAGGGKRTNIPGTHVVGSGGAGGGFAGGGSFTGGGPARGAIAGGGRAVISTGLPTPTPMPMEKLQGSREPRSAPSPIPKKSTGGWSSGPISVASSGSSSASSSGIGAPAGIQSQAQVRLGASQVSADPDALDRLEAACELCIEKNSYKNAKQLADKAIETYQALAYPPGPELAGLYLNRAWSNYKMGNYNLVSADANIAARVSNGQKEQAEVNAILSLVSSQQGKKDLAENHRNKFLELSKTAPASIIISAAKTELTGVWQSR